MKKLKNNNFMKHKNQRFYHKINSSIIVIQKTINHSEEAKQKKNNLLNTIADIKVKFTKINQTFKMFIIKKTFKKVLQLISKTLIRLKKKFPL